MPYRIGKIFLHMITSIYDDCVITSENVMTVWFDRYVIHVRGALKKMGKVGLLDQPADPPPPPPRKLVYLKVKKNFDVYFAF